MKYNLITSESSPQKFESIDEEHFVPICYWEGCGNVGTYKFPTKLCHIGKFVLYTHHFYFCKYHYVDCSYRIYGEKDEFFKFLFNGSEKVCKYCYENKVTPEFVHVDFNAECSLMNKWVHIQLSRENASGKRRTFVKFCPHLADLMVRMKKKFNDLVHSVLKNHIRKSLALPKYRLYNYDKNLFPGFMPVSRNADYDYLENVVSFESQEDLHNYMLIESISTELILNHSLG